jgi:hypothetical protein
MPLGCRVFSSKDSGDTTTTTDPTPKKATAGKKIQSKFMNPIVSQLWDQRQEHQQRLMSLTDSDSETTGSGNLSELTAIMYREGKPQGDADEPQFKHPNDSKVTIDYPFATDEFLLESYKSPGGTMRFGKVRFVFRVVFPESESPMHDEQQVLHT